jgi:hypothetical protein
VAAMRRPAGGGGRVEVVDGGGVGFWVRGAWELGVL